MVVVHRRVVIGCNRRCAYRSPRALVDIDAALVRFPEVVAQRVLGVDVHVADNQVRVAEHGRARLRHAVCRVHVALSRCCNMLHLKDEILVVVLVYPHAVPFVDVLSPVFVVLLRVVDDVLAEQSHRVALLGHVERIAAHREIHSCEHSLGGILRGTF